MTVVRTENLRKEYGTLVAVDNVSLTIEKGQLVGLIGPNGAGKTTLLRMLATVLPPTAGNAEIFDNNLTRDRLMISKSIGYLPDFFNLYNDLTLEECLQFFARAYDMPQAAIPELVERTLSDVGLKDKKKDFIRNLSRGMVQRLGVASLMVHDPDLYILDEPASGLDPRARIQLRTVLKKLSSAGKTVIISSHILTELSGFCTHIAIMDKGRLVLHGSVEDMEKKITGSRMLKIKVLNNIAGAQDIISKTNDVHLVRTDDDCLTVEFQGDLDAIANINALLVEQGIKVAALSEEKTNLEDLFLKISADNKLS